MDCLYTLFKSGIIDENVAKSVQMFDNVRRAVSFNQRTGQNAQHCKEEIFEEKVPEAFTELSPKDKIEANLWVSLCRKI